MTAELRGGDSHGRFAVGIENLLNVKAQDLLFYPRPGRWISGDLSWSV